MFNFDEELKKLPSKPGVYIMHDEEDAIIYHLFPILFLGYKALAGRHTLLDMEIQARPVLPGFLGQAFIEDYRFGWGG